MIKSELGRDTRMRNQQRLDGDLCHAVVDSILLPANPVKSKFHAAKVPFSQPGDGRVREVIAVWLGQTSDWLTLLILS